jgi:hypothetical protein
MSRYTKCIVEAERMSNVPKGTFELRVFGFSFLINKTVKDLIQTDLVLL